MLELQHSVLVLVLPTPFSTSEIPILELRFPAADTFTVETVTGTERFRISSGGLIGIGTVTPRSKLDIQGSDAELRFYRDAGDRFGGFRYTGSIFKLRLPTADHFAIDDSNNNEKFRVNSNGRVGIGTDDPDYEAHVYGAGDLLVEDSTNGSAHLRLRSSNGGTDVSNWKIKTSSNNFLYIENDTVGGPSQVAISTEGRFGIASAIPIAKLDVENVLGVETTTTAVSSTAATTVDSLPIATYRSSRFQVQITQGTDYQSADLMVIHDGTTATLIEYGSIATANMLATFTSTISGSNLVLQVNMGSSSSATVKVVRYGISI